MTNWKQAHANASDEAVLHPLVQEVIDEQLGNLRVPKNGIERYGLTKIAMYAAQVARAQALGFDPELLKVSAKEANQEMLKMAQACYEVGKPVFVIEVAEHPHE